MFTLRSCYSGRCERCGLIINQEEPQSKRLCDSCNFPVKLFLTLGELGLCGRCHLVKVIVGTHYSIRGEVCTECLHWLTAPKSTCKNCGEYKPVAERSSVHNPLCLSCYLLKHAQEGICCECQRFKLLHAYHPYHSGEMICGTCADRIRDPFAACSGCGKKKRLNNKHPHVAELGRVCSRCYKRLTQPIAECPRCKKRRTLSRLCDGVRICERCHRELLLGEPRHRSPQRRYPCIDVCAECGQYRKLERSHPKKPGGICSGCRKRTKTYTGHCAECGKRRLLIRKHPTKDKGSICRGCRQNLLGQKQLCPGCGRFSVLDAKNPAYPEQRVCSSCGKNKNGRAKGRVTELRY